MSRDTWGAQIDPEGFFKKIKHKKDQEIGKWVGNLGRVGRRYIQ